MSEASASRSVAAMDRDSARWVEELTAGRPRRDRATVELHTLLARAAHAEAARRSGYHGVAGVELHDLADQAAADATLSVLRRVTSFRGESRFTTWAHKFVIFELSAKLARHAYGRRELHPEPDVWERLPGALGLDPEQSAETKELVAAVRAGIEEAMTAHQRRMFVALVVDDTPLDALVADLGMNRNAAYKTVFDARRKLRAYLVERGFLTPTSPSRSRAAESTDVAGDESWDELRRLLDLDPRDVGCEQTWQLIDVYAELVRTGDDPEQTFPGITAHLDRCDPCAEDYRGLLHAMRTARGGGAGDPLGKTDRRNDTKKA